YPAGLEFVAAFYGCLYAGTTAIPLYPPRAHRVDRRLLAVLRDARATFALTQSTIWANSVTPGLAHAPELAAMRWLVTDELSGDLAAPWQCPPANSAPLAFLQYPSGSPSTPKGVMVSHGNLLRNSEMLRRGFGLDQDSVSVNWLPSFHDAGLINGII